MALGEDVVWNFAKFANEAEPGKHFKGVIGDVDFPPIEPLTRAGHVVVMVVVPAFPQSDEGEHPIVLAGVRGREAAIAENVGERVDGERAMPEKRSAEAESPSKQGPATDEQEGNSQDGGRKQVILVQPAKLGEFGEVADVVETGFIILIGKNPADMRPPEAEERGGMEIVFLVGVAVVMPVMSSPPENAFLRGGHGHPGDDELKPAAGLKGAVREVAVVTGSNKEHAHFVQKDAGDQIGPLELKEKDAEGREMNEKKRDRGNELQPCPVGQGNG